MKCIVCNREAGSDLCRYHKAAKDEVLRVYPIWVKAYGELEWKAYLDNVKRNTQTGHWAKEIAQLLGDS